MRVRSPSAGPIKVYALICARCKQDLPVTEFYWKNKSKGTKSSNCKACKVLYNKEHYLKNTHKYKIKARKHATIYRDKYREFKSTLKCTQCGEDHPATLDFHHTENNKEFAIANMINRGIAWDRILHELTKCIVLCSNCHRKHHFGV